MVSFDKKNSNNRNITRARENVEGEWNYNQNSL